jgi:hypothetical protein
VAGLQRAVEAVNAAGPPAGRLEAPELAAAFAGVLRAYGEREEPAAVAPQAALLRAALDDLHAIFATPDPDAAVERLNASLARSTGALRLVREPGTHWHLHADAADASLAEWFRASSLLAMAVHVAERGAPAWGACRAAACGRVYARTGPGRPRRTCSAACAGRLRQAELRARRRVAPDGASPAPSAA